MDILAILTKAYLSKDLGSPVLDLQSESISGDPRPIAMNDVLQTRIARYVAALTSLAAALGLTLSARPFFATTSYALFLAAVMFSSWFGGLTPGLIVVLLSVFSLDRYFSPQGLSRVLSRDDVIELGIFLLVGGMISYLSRARIKAEHLLWESNQQLEHRIALRTLELRKLSAKLLQSQDEERRRTAKLLHETVAQDLAALKMELAVAKRLGKWENPEGKTAIEQAQALADESIREARTVSYLLHPPLLDEAGLSTAVHWYVAGFERRSGIRTELDLPPDFGRLPADIETTVFRFVQECLTNVHRHSGSSNALVSIQTTSGQVIVAVTDTGHGMPQSITDGGGESGAQFGVGLMGLLERVQQAGGNMQIQSNARGTTVTATLPREGAQVWGESVFS
jgi:signal transduction histidine kinase